MSGSPTLPPPQAYTREVLSQAYTWLQGQPEAVKRLATSPDALAGLFLRAQRFATTAMESEAPVSAQNFMTELRSLAANLSHFDQAAANSVQLPQGRSPSGFANSSSAATPAQNLASTHFPPPNSGPAHGVFLQNSTPTAGQQVQVSAQPSPSMPITFAAGAYASASPSHAHGQAHNQHVPPAQTAASQSMQAGHSLHNGSGSGTLGLSALSQGILAEVRKELNLSTEAEALNLLIGVGYKKLKPLISQ